MDSQPAQEKPIRRIAVFCGSSSGVSPLYGECARKMGSLLASRGTGLVYGGGTVGLMGETARAVHEGGAEVFGCIPKALAPRELSGEMIGHLVVVDDMHQRKAEMARQADGFIGLPGGFGTLEELLEVITWQQLGFHNKPVGLLNVNGYFDQLLQFFNHSVEQGFIRREHNCILVSDDPAALVDMMQQFKAPKSWVAMHSQAAASTTAIGADISSPSPR
eukprot:CAMPEP_0202359480 /NCGR_PEP_ID=MMETSP1126-20121109/12763_1 /ASSEMBLY_ACC=CAM_ASM_000457 /TAXON_ID=3047 /ORGANISM="Dunaliella tertiolecta, Strain CCMP1320" /LENGTH=218 /DNA_ID=CAMNT_0048952915 /DNA_START=196 /DNA_END=852 /DNA_ORIENTATION=+